MNNSETKMSSPLLSIIIPVYNTASYLDNCLDSIVKYKGEDLEIILIDDGSSDHSGDICDKRAGEDTRIKVIHKKNEGAAIARNIGIKAAKGKWISFVDSDDTVSDQYVYTIKQLDNEADLVIFSLRLIQSNGEVTRKINDDQLYDSFESIQNGIMRMIINEKNCEFFVFTCNKFYKRDIIAKNRISFKEHLTFREDELFATDYCRYVKSIRSSSADIYNYRIGITNSLSNRRKGTAEICEFAMSLVSKSDYFSNQDLRNLECARALDFVFNSYDKKEGSFDIIYNCLKSIIIDNEASTITKKSRLLNFLYKLPKFVSYNLIHLIVLYYNSKNERSKKSNAVWE